MTTLTLAEELALLSYTVEGTAEVGQPGLDYGLAGALLLELTLAERIDVVDGRVVLTDPTRTGHPLLDRALDQIGGEAKRRKPKDWINRLGKGLRDQVLDHLVAMGILHVEKDRVLGLFPRTRFPSPHGMDPAAETEARQRLAAAIRPGATVPPRTGALCSLVRAVGLDRKVFRDQPRREVRARLKEISEGDWASAAVKRAIDDTQAAMIAVITAATVSTSAASN
ncbi:GPP34 family phosphoprotein [Plantactinospora sp. GCM10030261]|uniref:GOLPH3/VPS74 family protein n=1 Tax=Plantactinospora sp. GCM10030261 TaxID=3273420 RepID=UPI00360F9C18